MPKPHIAVLGAGPAGLGAAWQLVKSGKARVTILEQSERVGGNAGSFDLAGMRVDYGSHRLHPACDQTILKDLRELLGDDLLERPRHGRIYLKGRWIHFPLKPQDLAMKLPLSFGAGVARDSIKKFIPQRSNGNGHETFSSVLEAGLGETICRDFYFPYARKIWGLPPEDLSAIQARRRVSAGSLGKMARKIISIVPGFKTPGAGKFFYPAKGYGQISEAIASAATGLGAEMKLGCRVTGITLSKKHTITFEFSGATGSLEADHIWSTIPISVFARITDQAPAEVTAASEEISYRAMILIYLVLETDQWTPYDAHYFPGADIKLTRLSEPKNYSGGRGARGRTVLCGELPCTVGDEMWRATDDELGLVVRQSLESCGLKLETPVLEVLTKRLGFAYPIYKDGYEVPFEIQDHWAEGLDRVLTFGRQGLFAHDNTHHALAMAYGAVDCLDGSGNFDRAKWAAKRKEFSEHVVED